MKQSYENELTPEVREGLKKNLVYVGMFSIIMLFAGLTSAYYVSMSDSFWLVTPLPKAFFTSTILIAISSLTFIAAIQFAKKQNLAMLKLFITATLLLGIGFVYFQFQGYKYLVNNGIHVVNKNILVSDGRYGDYFALKYKGDHLEVDGNDYYLKGKLATPNQMKAISEFSAQFTDAARKNGLKKVTNYGKDFLLLYNDEPMLFMNGNLIKADGKKLEYLDLSRLSIFATHLKDGRGDFFLKGKMGEDFQIFYKGEELAYKERSLYKGNQKLSPYLQNSAANSPDTANSYMYMITFIHLMHIIVTLIFLIKTVTYSYRGKYTNGDTLGLRATGIFWHFLGLLWLFLLLFLLFIHKLA